MPSLWTGEKAVFLDTGGQGALRALAYSPDSEAWRSLPPAPLRAKGSDAIWTGSEVIVWGGGGRAGPAAEAGAAYEPASDAWRKIADAPLSLNSVSLIWSGSEVIALGSRLDLRNRSSSRYAEGAAYDPVIDTWRRLEDSGLSPQAHAAEWVGRQMVAYDYVTRFQRYDPERNRWSSKRRMPLEAGECYPDSVTVGGLMVCLLLRPGCTLRPRIRQLEGDRGRSERAGQPLKCLRQTPPGLAFCIADGDGRHRLLPRRRHYLQRQG